MMDFIKNTLVVFIVVVIVYFAGSAFIDLVSGLYHLLDEYIYAFFAGIIAFLGAISLVGIMIQVAVWTVIALLWIFVGIGYAILSITGQR